MCKVEFKTDNASFKNDDGTLWYEEIAVQLRHIADRIDEGYKNGVVVDFNGNSCGKWEIGD